MRAGRTHALCTFEGALVEVDHGDVAVEPVAEGEGTIAGVAPVVALFEMCDAVVLVGVAALGKGLVADFTGERLETMGGADVGGERIWGGGDVGAVLAGEREGGRDGRGEAGGDREGGWGGETRERREMEGAARFGCGAEGGIEKKADVMLVDFCGRGVGRRRELVHG